MKTLRMMKPVGLSVLALALALPAFAQDSKFPSVVKVALVKEITGSAGFAGEAARKGIETAVKEINDSDYLGKDVDLQVDVMDTASDTKTALTMTAKAAADSQYVAILGPSNSNAGAPAAPIAQRAKVPMVFSQSLGDGVLVGDYIFRVTGPLDAYYGLAVDYLKSQGVKTVSVLFNSTSLRQAQAAKDMLPPMAKEAGIEILSSTGVPLTSTDFTAIASKIAGEKPDAVIYYMAGAQQLTAIQQVRRAGFNGIQLGGSSIENSLSNVGEAGEGIIWVSNFSYLSSNKTSAAFTKLYEGIFNERPLVYAAEGYDSVWWIARGLKEAGTATREALKDGLTAVGKAGFEGAQGPITFVDNDARTGGILIQWKGGQQTVLAESN